MLFFRNSSGFALYRSSARRFKERRNISAYTYFVKLRAGAEEGKRIVENSQLQWRCCWNYARFVLDKRIKLSLSYPFLSKPELS